MLLTHVEGVCMKHGTGTSGGVVVPLPRSNVCSGVVVLCRGYSREADLVFFLLRVYVCFSRLVEEMLECVLISRSVYAWCFDSVCQVLSI